MSDCCSALQSEFDDRAAKRQYRRYKRRGPDKTTRWLIEMLVARGVKDAVALDIGGGLGGVPEGLLEAGAGHVHSVDASAAYTAAAQRLAAERGFAEKVTRHVADFVEAADGIPAVDVVTLDRVICCYPHMDRLVSAAAAKAGWLYGFVVPRERKGVRLAIRTINFVRRLLGSDFRVFAHQVAAIDDVLERAGFTRDAARHTMVWEVRVYRRTGERFAA